MKRLLVAFLATLAGFLILRWQSAPLVTPATPTGILALEFCNDLSRLDNIMSVWNRDVAARAVIIDFAFLFSYGALFYAGIKYVYAGLVSRDTRYLADWMLAIGFIAPLLDIIENACMLATISGVRSMAVLQVTRYAAIVKFVAAAIVVLYLLVSLPGSYVVSKKTAISK